ncbi:hypothetical protein QCA50_004773 [Cerrena zonata]|uniref:Uncharacterized protein n=1 Tax=Cerrena zonata TaxID=2478898 RepID=A0AAW0GP42_9APHY
MPVPHSAFAAGIPFANPSPAPIPNPTGTAVNSKTHLVVYFDNEEVVLKKTDIPPEPPALHFSNNIDGLLREWHQSQRLVIGGQGIPIKYWDLIYKAKASARPSVWKAIRAEWGNWKFIAEERDRLGTDKAFWDKFTGSDGVRLTYQKILDSLQAERMRRDQQDYDEAIRLFGGRLDREEAGDTFKYKKDNICHVCTSVQGVADRWRKLKAATPTIVTDLEAAPL